MLGKVLLNVNEEFAHLTVPLRISSVQGRFGACYITGQ